MPIERLPPEAGAWTITKRQVVAGHLTRAFDLFVLQDDPLSAHLLCGAARDIVHSVGEKEGKEKLWDHVEVHIREDKRRAFFGAMKDEYNFLKHADREPDVLDHYTTKITSLLLWETSVNTEILFGRPFMETTMFQTWYMSWRQDAAKEAYAAKLKAAYENSPEAYDVHGRLKWESLQEGFRIINARRAMRKAVPLPFLADEKAGPPMGVGDSG